MRVISEYIPLLLFFIVFKLVDIYWATAVLMTATFIQIAYSYCAYRKISTRQWVMFSLASLLGTLTLVFHDEQFVKLKATAIYATLSVSLMFSRYVLGKNLVKKSLGSILQTAYASKKPLKIPNTLWDVVNLFWAFITACIAVLNLYIAYYCSLDFWVNFKVFGLMGMTFLSILTSIIMVYKYLPDEDDNPTLNDKKNL
jgi:intracellular septation protein